ncbi:MAG: Zinc phosphodiesterase ELAC protein 2 [Marteilia pararefringens]
MFRGSRLLRLSSNFGTLKSVWCRSASSFMTKMAAIDRQSQAETFAKVIQIYPLDDNERSSCALMIVDGERYLFNCSEGVQYRLFYNAVSKVNNVFVTSKEWKYLGGLPGVGFTVNNSTSQEDLKYLRAYGNQLNLSSQCFLGKNDVDILSNFDVSSQKEINFQKFTVYPICNGQNKASYLIKFNHRDPKIVMSKLMEYDIDFRQIRELKSKKKIEFDGKIIELKDVSQDNPEYPSVLITDVNNIEELGLLKEKLKEMLPSFAIEKLFNIHFTNQEFSKSQEFKEFINSYFNHTKSINLILGSSETIATNTKHSKFNMMLNEYFPDFIKLKSHTEKSFKVVQNGQIQQIAPMYFNLSDFRGDYNVKSISSAEKERFSTTTSFRGPSESLLSELNDLKEDCKKNDQINFPKKETPNITFIGTGSAIPSTYRNSSSILFEQNGNYCLVDCGENTLANIISLYGNEKCEEILIQLKGILISHEHLDHCVGIYNIINKIIELRAKKGIDDLQIPVVGHSAFLSVFKSVENIWNFDNNRHVNLISENVPDEIQKTSLNQIFCDLRVAKVNHIRSSIAFRATFHDGFVISYSGDTSICQALIDLVQDSDILINEATFENKHNERASTVFHCTNEDALNVLHTSRSKIGILTHFSQRYGTFATYEPEIPGNIVKNNFGCTLDNLYVTSTNLPLLNKFTKLTKKLEREIEDSNNSVKMRDE